MKKTLAFAVAFALFASTQAFAIIGAGAHYLINAGASLKGDDEVISIDNPLPGGAPLDISLKREKASGMQGIGFKAWIDILPFIDIEGTFNVAVISYSPYLAIPNPISSDTTKIFLEYAMEAPFNTFFDRVSPIYGFASGDVSVTYPITSLPVIRPYAGLGVSYMAGLPLMDKKFTEPMIGEITNIIFSDPTNLNLSEDDQKAIIKKFTDRLKDSDYTTGLGGHIIVGVRAKLPIIPIAAYANTKYYFGGGTNSAFSQGVVFELGGGLAL
jgi:hypothetical protein